MNVDALPEWILTSVHQVSVSVDQSCVVGRDLVHQADVVDWFHTVDHFRFSTLFFSVELL